MFKAPGETKLKVFSSTLTKRTPAKVDGDSPSTTGVQGMQGFQLMEKPPVGDGLILWISWDMMGYVLYLDCRS